jgi:hypothetical protein
MSFHVFSISSVNSLHLPLHIWGGYFVVVDFLLAHNIVCK